MVEESTDFWRRLQDYLLVDLGWSRITVDRISRYLRRAQRNGVQLTPFDQESGRVYLRKRIEAGASSFALNNDVKALNAAFRFHNQADAGPYRRRRVPPSSYKYLTKDEVARVLAYRHPDERIQRFRRALVLWALKSGMRASEIAAMNTDDLSPTDSKFLVRKPAKLGNRRWLPIEPWIWHPKRPFQAYLSKREPPKSDPKAVWVVHASPKGRKHGPARRAPQAELLAAMKEIAKATGVPQLNFVVTRHTRGTELLRRWGDIMLVKRYLGHSKVSTTEIYAASRHEDMDAAMRNRPGANFYPKGRDL